MKSRSEWPTLTPDQIDEEVKIRWELIDQMIGGLYPAILVGEIEDLKELKADPQGRLPL